MLMMRRREVLGVGAGLLATPAVARNWTDWRRSAEEWRDLGATHLSVNTMGCGLTGPDAHVERLRQAKEALTF